MWRLVGGLSSGERERRALSVSCLGVAAWVALGSVLYGNGIYGVTLVLVAVAHLAVVLRFHPRLDRFFVLVHYLLLVTAVGSVVGDVARVVGLESRAGAVLWALLVDSWSYFGGKVRFALEIVGVLSMVVAAVLGVGWLVRRGRPTSEAIQAGVFAGSVLVFPCFYAFDVPLSRASGEWVTFSAAIGLSGLELPTILHVLTLAAILVYRRIGRVAL
jgi:hypothetical protein